MIIAKLNSTCAAEILPSVFFAFTKDKECAAMYGKVTELKKLGLLNYDTSKRSAWALIAPCCMDEFYPSKKEARRKAISLAIEMEVQHG